jgi:hypothetical protein
MYLEKSNDLPSIRHELPVVLALLHIIISTEPSGYKSPGSTSGPGFDSRGSEFLRILTAFVLSVVGDVPVGSEAPVCGGFVNLEDLPARSPKMLLGVGVCVRVFIGIVNVSVVFCNSQKK